MAAVPAAGMAKMALASGEALPAVARATTAAPTDAVTGNCP